MRDRCRWVAWAAAAAHAALLWVLSSRTGVGAGPWFPGVDKLQHGVAYALLGALLALGVGARGSARGRWLLAVALAAGYGAVDEWHQSWVPGRDSSAWDWVADTLGAGLGAAVVVYRSSRRARHRAAGAVDVHRP